VLWSWGKRLIYRVSQEKSSEQVRLKQLPAIARASMTALEPGKLLDRRYKIVQPLAKGGFGRTYIAADTRRPGNPQCVVKHLKPASHDATFLDHARRLFATEAETLEQLGNHSQIPRLLAYFEEEQEFYLVQDLIEGHPLSYELQSAQTWPDSQIWQMLQDILGILVFVHSRGVIHRDIKPDNIIRRRHDGKLVLVDFGAVKQIQAHPIQGQIISTIAVGTPGYMPTEQSNGKPRPNSDIYALGIIGIQAATGLTPAALSEDLDTGELIWPSSHIPDELTAILARMVRYHFKDRYQSAAEALYAVEQLLVQYPGLETEIRYSSISLKSNVKTSTPQKFPASYPPILSVPKLTDAISSLEDTLAAPSAHTPLPTPSEEALVSGVEGHQPSLQAPPITELSQLAAVDSLPGSSTPSHVNGLSDDHASEAEASSLRSLHDRLPNPTAPLAEDDGSFSRELVAIPSTILDFTEVVAKSDASLSDRASSVSPIPQTPGIHRQVINKLWMQVPYSPRRAIQNVLGGSGRGQLRPSAPPANPSVWKILVGTGVAASMVVVGIPAVVRALFFIEQAEFNSHYLMQLPVSNILVAGLPCQSVSPASVSNRQPALRQDGATPVDYYGSVQAGKPADGQGVSVFRNGDRFDGEFRNGTFNGCGTVTFADSYITTYVGQFQDGLYQGVGLLTWENGDRYIGQFEQGKCQGKGTFIAANHQSITGVWEKGNLQGHNLSCNKVNTSFHEKS
jgi:serine/threonine protein kinase